MHEMLVVFIPVFFISNTSLTNNNAIRLGNYLKTRYIYRTPFLPVILSAVLFLTGCHNPKSVTGSTLILHVTFYEQQIIPVGHDIRQQPYYRNETSTPVYKAVLLDTLNKQLGTVLFDKSIFLGNGKIYDLAFPFYDSLHRIVLYELDPGSGHITNKDHNVVLNWVLPPEKAPPDSTGSFPG